MHHNVEFRIAQNGAILYLLDKEKTVPGVSKILRKVFDLCFKTIIFLTIFVFLKIFVEGKIAVCRRPFPSQKLDTKTKGTGWPRSGRGLEVWRVRHPRPRVRWPRAAIRRVGDGALYSLSRRPLSAFPRTWLSSVTQETWKTLEGLTGVAQCILQGGTTKGIVEPIVDQPTHQILKVVEVLLEQKVPFSIWRVACGAGAYHSSRCFEGDVGSCRKSKQ